MAWVLRDPTGGTGSAGAWKKILRGSPTLRDPQKCSHLHRRWRGGFAWDCVDCGEAVRDREDRTQTTFTRLFLHEQECAHTETFIVCGNVADPALEGQVRCKQCHRPMED